MTLREKEFLVDSKNRVYYVCKVYTNEVIGKEIAEITKVKWSRKLSDFKFKNKTIEILADEADIFKFRSYNPDEAWNIAMLLKEMEYDRCGACGVCCEDIE